MQVIQAAGARCSASRPAAGEHTVRGASGVGIERAQVADQHGYVDAAVASRLFDGRAAAKDDDVALSLPNGGSG
jgi:hypothetical protein